jgi:hypothetical protein
VELVGGRRIAPLFDTRRGLWSTFFTQEYEGRDCDISLIPWISHRGFWSALAHCIYNPNAQEFVEWGRAAERETWKYIPAIKSHIAEEVTLDRCVQRLRKRIIAESWEKKRQESLGNRMGDRTPSFFSTPFNTPSMAALGGLSVADQVHFTAEDSAQTAYDEMQRQSNAVRSEPLNDSALQNGWGGMGLSGNQSDGSLNRCASGASGLFLMDDEHIHSDQAAGENSVSPMQQAKLVALASAKELDVQYVKTTSMAKFYYRKQHSEGDLVQSRSAGDLNNGSHDETAETAAPRHGRTRSKSSVDLGNDLKKHA